MMQKINLRKFKKPMPCSLIQKKELITIALDMIHLEVIPLEDFLVVDLI